MTAFIAILMIVLPGIALFILLSGIAIYARVVKLRTAVTSSWSEIDTLLKERYALVSEIAEVSADLKGNSDLKRLQTQLRQLEDNIAAAGRDYNAAVRDYNFEIEAFPSRLFAKRYGLEKAKFFDMKLP